MTARSGEARCDLTDLIAAQCAHCTGRTGDGRTARAARQDARPSSPPRGGRCPAAPHICLSCGGAISPGQAEELVPIARGPQKGSAQHRHACLEDCRAALARPPGGNAAFIGRYQELAPFRVVSPHRAQA